MAGTPISNLTAAQKTQVTTGIDKILTSDAQEIYVTAHANNDIQPAFYVSSTIVDNTGVAGTNGPTRVAGIYSYIEQTGTNTVQFPKSICGVSVNAAVGNNDSTGIVGYTYKLDVVGGVGDAAGCGGATHQRSTREGLAIGGEFSVHQWVPGTSSSPSAGNGNNSIALHVTTNSSGARAFAGFVMDSTGLSAGKYGFWNAISIARSTFAAGGEGINAGTVGINFGNNTTTGPEKALFLGNATYHFWRPTDVAVRLHAHSLDVLNSDGPSKVRLFTSASAPEDCIFGVYSGTIGPDGTTTLTARGQFAVTSDGYAVLTAYRDTTGSTYTRVACSPVSNAFIPIPNSGTGTTSLGAANRLWSQVFASTAAINTSDERYKTDIEAIPDAALDAWGDVEFQQFRFLDATRDKGRAARLHSGVVAQRVVEAFSRRGLNASDYGLLCFDDWEESPDVEQVDRVLKKHAIHEQVLQRPAVLDADGNELKPAVYADGDVIEPEEYEEIRTVTPGVKAGSRYGIRYDEALSFEAAYQRRRASLAERRLEMFEDRLAALEARVR